MLQRMIRAAKLDADLYETVEADRGYTGEGGRHRCHRLDCLRRRPRHTWLHLLGN